MHLVDNETPVSDTSDDEPVGPVLHYINFKTRRALVCRGEAAQVDAESRGFKKVSSAHFHKYLATAKNGFRRRPGGR